MISPALFDHEKLDVYQLELKFLSWVTQFLADLSRLSATETRELRQQLDRASLSALLNTAEGNGRRQHEDE
jgi:four helix bundle protein